MAYGGAGRGEPDVAGAGFFIPQLITHLLIIHSVHVCAPARCLVLETATVNKADLVPALTEPAVQVRGLRQMT